MNKRTSSHTHLNYSEAHEYVDSFENTDKKQVFWDGYDIVVWKRNPGAYMTKSAAFRDGGWGSVRRISYSDRGTWRVPVNP